MKFLRRTGAELGRFLRLAIIMCLSFISMAHADWADDSLHIQALVRSGEYVAAEQFASESLKRGPGGFLFSGMGTLTIHYWRGRLRLLLGDTAGAIEDADTLITATSSLMPVDMGYALRAVARAQTGDTNGAMADFDSALGAARSGMMTGLRTYGIIAERAVVKLLLNDLVGAEADLTDALAGNQDAFRMGDYVAARKESWTNLRAAIGKLKAGDARSAKALATKALVILQKSNGPAATPEFVTTYLAVAQFDRLGDSGGVALNMPGAPGTLAVPDRPEDGAILALLTTGPKQMSTWGINSSDAKGGGMLIKAVGPGSPAAAAGMQADDVLLAINDTPLKNYNDWLAKREILPLFTPLRLSIRRNGKAIESTIVVPGRVRYTVVPLDPRFPIPGISPPPSMQTLSAVETLDAFNVLDRVVLDPISGKVAVIGHYDKRYNTGPILYLDLLKTALAYPTPRFNIMPSPDTARLLEELAGEFSTKLSNFPFAETVRFVQGHPDLERDRQLLIRELARLYGITPGEYAAWYNFARLDVQRDDYTDMLPPAPLRDAIVTAHRTLGYPGIADALALIYLQTPDSAAQALRVLGLGDEAAEIQARGGQDAYGVMLVTAYLAMAEQTGSLSMADRTELRKLYDSKRMSWQNLVRTAESVLPFVTKHSKVDVMHQAFNRILMSNPAGLMVFPRLQKARSESHPIDLDRNTQLASIMFEADYAFKSLSARPELFAQIPGYLTQNDFLAKTLQGHSGNGKTSRIWMEPQKVDMTVSPGRNVIDFALPQMAVKTEDATDLINVSASDKDKPDPYMVWTTQHMMAHFDEYAHIIPAFHKVREAAKIMALAKWLLAEKVRVDLDDVRLLKWDMPMDYPQLNLIYQEHAILPNGGYKSKTVLISSGGVSFKPRGNWTSVTPSVVSETRAVDHLAVSASLGQQAVKSLADGNLAQARDFAELSAQAMNGSLTRADLNKLNIVVPDVKGISIGPTSVQLQKEILKTTYRQIDRAQQQPNAHAAISAAAAQLENIYNDVQSNPASASDYLLKLQTRQIVAAPVIVKPAPIPVVPPVPVAVAAPIFTPTGSACTVTLAQNETIPDEQKAYLNNKLAEARNRLRHINEALSKLGALNAKQRQEIEKMTNEITKDYEAATERAYDFAVSMLTDLPLAKYADIHSSKIAELENYIKSQNQLRTVPMSDSAIKAIEFDIAQMTALRNNYQEAFSSTERMLNIYAGTNYGSDIDKWDQDTRSSGDRKRGFEATKLGGKIMLDHPWLEKYLTSKDWFGGNKLWQVVAMGKMAWTASDFFWDIMNQYGAWQPMANSLLKDLQFNAQAMDQLRLKAQKTSQEIGCIEKLVQH